MTTYKRGDWVTLHEPNFLSGRRAVVVDLRIKLMTVAYVDGTSVGTRNVPIDSVTLGHSGRAVGLEAISDAFGDLKPEHAREFAEFAVDQGALAPDVATDLVDAYVTKLTSAKEALESGRIEQDKARLSRWLEADAARSAARSAATTAWREDFPY